MQSITDQTLYLHSGNFQNWGIAHASDFGQNFPGRVGPERGRVRAVGLSAAVGAHVVAEPVGAQIALENGLGSHLRLQSMARRLAQPAADAISILGFVQGRSQRLSCAEHLHAAAVAAPNNWPPSDAGDAGLSVRGRND